MSYMKSLPARPTRDQLVAWKIQQGECGLIPQDFTVACPQKQGPVNPHVDHPHLVGYPGANGYSTCSGCDHFLGLWLDSYVCTHPYARAVAARALAEAIRHWEEAQCLPGRAPTALGGEKVPEPRSEEPLQAATGQISLF